MIVLHVINTTSDDGVRCAIVELVPAVDNANAQLGELLLNLLDPVQELVGTQGTPVKTFRADGNRTDDFLVPRHSRLEDIEVLVERLIIVGPVTDTILVPILVPIPAKRIPEVASYQTPNTTLKPLSFAAGRIFLAASQLLAE